ncbi:MAG: YdiU family protein, partial [Alphaproteobacteria bacterium]|nr:YdiU family protein [Alphaproteobacteria bacterium]
ARSHVRVGTFQYFAARGDQAAVARLADYVIDRNYPQLGRAANPYLALLQEVIRRQSELVARWLLIGFVHGVMNTDNMSVAGETIDFGPCAFLDHYDPFKVFSSIDSHGRYAYGRQPQIAAWNLARFAETLLPLLGADEDTQMAEANAALSTFTTFFGAAYRKGLCAKLGLDHEEEADVALAQDLLARMAEGKADFTLVFRTATEAAEDPAADDRLRRLFAAPELYDEWARSWHARLDAAPAGARIATMRRANPRYIPRNHRIEQAIRAAMQGDFSLFRTLVQLWQAPYDEQPEFAEYAAPPLPDEEVSRTFCGT